MIESWSSFRSCRVKVTQTTHMSAGPPPKFLTALLNHHRPKIILVFYSLQLDLFQVASEEVNSIQEKYFLNHAAVRIIWEKEKVYLNSHWKSQVKSGQA